MRPTKRILAVVHLVLRALAGIGSLLPMLGVLATAGYCAYVLIAHDLAAGGGQDPVARFIDQSLWQVVLGASVAIALLQLLLMIGFTVHVFTRKSMTAVAKALWVAAFYLLGMVAMPVYWLLHMLREESPEH